MQPDGTVNLTDFTGPTTDPGGGQYELLIGDRPPDHNPFTDYPHYGDTFDLSLYSTPTKAVAASLAHNLAVRREKIWACWGPGLVVGWIGDPAHQAKCSDHNKDSAGVVHAIDPMVTGTYAQTIVDQCRAHGADLQYVIHNGVIWSVTVDWEPRVYLGADRHTNHVHISGRHGGSHGNLATCTGYSLTAQASTPTFDICPTEGDDMTHAEMETLADLIATALVDKWIKTDLGKPGGGDTMGVVYQTGILGNGTKMLGKLDEIVTLLTPPVTPPAA